MSMSDEDTRKMDEIRKFSAIYGRFDCKRKPEKPLTLHEVNLHKQKANSAAMFSFNFTLPQNFRTLSNKAKTRFPLGYISEPAITSVCKIRLLSHLILPKDQTMTPN